MCNETPPDEFENDDKECMYQVPHEGELHDNDNRAMYLKLKEYLFNTTGYTWIEEFNRSDYGQAVFQAWSNHYNGMAELNKHTKLAKAELKSLHNRNKKYVHVI